MNETNKPMVHDNKKYTKTRRKMFDVAIRLSSVMILTLLPAKIFVQKVMRGIGVQPRLAKAALRPIPVF
jgi:hypothetical protein